MRKILILSALVLVIIGCNHNNVSECQSPMIKVGAECCDDYDGNSICDSLELQKDSNITEKSPGEKDTIFINEHPASPGRKITLYQLENGINRSFYPLKRYAFEDLNRSNLTGIEKTFEIREDGRFYILKIKKGINFLNNFDNFSSFINQRYNLNIKNSKILAEQTIDFNSLTDSRWDGAENDYDFSLDKVKVLGEDAFLEKHVMFLHKNGHIRDISILYKLNLLCSPEFVVEIYPKESWGFIYSESDSLEPKKEFVKKELEEQKKDILATAEIVSKTCTGNPEDFFLKHGETVFYGVDGFYPNEVSLNIGEKLAVFNQNSRNENIILTLVMERPRKTITSGSIKPGERGEIELVSAGNYTLFEMNYKPRAKIIVG